MDISVYVRQWIYCALLFVEGKTFPYIYKVVVKTICNLFFCVFVNCLVKQFAICVAVFAILLLKVMELLCVVGGGLLDRPCMVFHRMCVLCLWSQ